jgi:sterol 3beta-glucosyltransferase
VSPLPIPQKRLTAERLTAAISTAVGDTTMQERAAALGTAIRAENGVARAVALVETHAGGSPVKDMSRGAAPNRTAVAGS